jgi:hypothetical protein
MTNLLLYVESRRTLARLRGEAQPESHPDGHDFPLPQLPDDLFEELGYTPAAEPDDYGALFDDLMAWLHAPEPALTK